MNWRKVNKTWRELLSIASFQKKLGEMLIEKKKNEEKLYHASKEGNAEEEKKLSSILGWT